MNYSRVHYARSNQLLPGLRKIPVFFFFFFCVRFAQQYGNSPPVSLSRRFPAATTMTIARKGCVTSPSCDCTYTDIAERERNRDGLLDVTLFRFIQPRERGAKCLCCIPRRISFRRARLTFFSGASSYSSMRFFGDYRRKRREREIWRRGGKGGKETRGQRETAATGGDSLL